MDPLATMDRLHGEGASLLIAGSAPPYDPRQPADYVPPAPVGTPVRGFTETKLVVEGAANGATAAFTISATELPAGLKANTSQLAWAGVTYLVVGFRQRRFRGQMNGYTLFLKG